MAKVGIGLALLGLAGAAVMWLVNPQSIAYSARFWILILSIIIACVGLVLIVAPVCSRIFGQIMRGRILYIAHGQGDPWLQTNLGVQDYRATAYTPGTLYTYRIAVGNKGGTVVRDVEVKLTSVLPKPPRFNSIGGNLQFRHEAESIKMKDIHPTKQTDHMDAQFVDLFRIFRSDAGSGDYLMAATTVEGQERSRLLQPIQTYKLTITATGRGGAHTSKDFEFVVTDDALPILKPI